MFDIPISNNVTPALGLDSLASGNIGGQAMPTPNSAPAFNPQPMQGGNLGQPQPMPNNNGFGQQTQPMSNGFGQSTPTPMGNQGFGQQGQSMNQGFGQPTPQAQPMNQGFGQPAPQAQPMNQNLGQPQPMNNGFGQSAPQAQPMNQGFGQSTPQQSGGFTNNPRPKGNGVVLSKGQKTSLSKMNPNLDLIEVGLGWDVALNTAIPYDLDATAFMLGADGKVLSDEWMIFYNQTMSPDGSCKHLGDNKDGSGVGDDEVIQLQLSRVNPQVAKIAFVISINEALQRGHNFGGVQNAYVRVVDKSTNRELIKFNLTDFFAEVTSMTVGELYLKNGEWRFNAVGQGLKTDLAGLCGFYGVDVNG